MGSSRSSESSSSEHSLYYPLVRTAANVEIRLIEILDTADGRISCRLSTSSIEDQPVFAALSYV